MYRYTEGREYGKTEEGSRRKIYPAEHQHGAGTAGQGNGVLQAAGQSYIVGDPAGA